MTHQQNNRLKASTPVDEMITTLTHGNVGAMDVLFRWLQQNRKEAFLSFITSLDLKHLYDSHIWEVYKDVCGEDLDRFIYHVQMELPDQDTGEHGASGPYLAQVDVDAFLAKRTFGQPGSYWALESPPDTPYYTYPIV